MDWIAAEWDHKALRLWGMQGAGIASTHVLTLEGPIAAARLGALVTEALGASDLPIFAAGPLVDGAAQVPAKLAALQQVRVDTWPGPITLMPGWVQDSPADLVDGEQARVAGVLAQNPKFDGVICLVGAQTRWLHISAEEVVSFQSVMTCELAEVMAASTGISAAGNWDMEAFDQAVGDAMSRPQSLAAQLHRIGAERRLKDLPEATARARLWGLLIGVELAATRPYWLGQEVVVIGTETACAPYVAALTAQGAWRREEDGAAMALAGLVAAHLGQDARA